MRQAGGVIGLWGLGLLQPSNGWDVGRRDPQGYAFALGQLVNKLGDDHVALGTDLHGLGESSSVNDYGDVQNVVRALRANGMQESSIEKVCFQNYARVLKASLKA